MLNNSGKYVKTVILIKELLKDFDNDFTFTGQTPGKSGVNITLQVNKDKSEPVVDKKTGRLKDDNYLAVFPVTIVGATYPLPFKKGDRVSIGDFRPEISYYIDYKLILRFGEIHLREEKNDTNEK